MENDDILERIRARSGKQAETTKATPAKKTATKKTAPKKKAAPKKAAKPQGPISNALAIEKRGRYYYVIQFEIQDGKVLNETVSEDMLRGEAINEFKILAARHFMGAVVVKASDE